MSKMSYHHTPLGCPLDGRVWHQILEAKAEQEPDTEAGVFYDMNMKRSTLTYAEYRDRSAYLASSLIELGLSYGQRAIVMGISSPQYLISIMALHRIGAKAILMSPGDLTTDKVNFIITKNLDCRLIAYDPEMADSQAKQLMTGIKKLVQHNVKSGGEPQIIMTLKEQVKSNMEFGEDAAQVGHAMDNTAYRRYEELIKHGQSLELDMLLAAQGKVQIDDEILALFTSGSTGNPKIVQMTMHSLVNVFTGTPIIGIKQRIKLYHNRPLCWIAGYLYGHANILCHITTVFVPPAMTVSEQSNENIFKIWEEEKCSFCALSAVLMNKLLKNAMHLKYDLAHVKMFLIGGQHFNLSSIKAIFDVLPDVKFNLIYACTESCKIASELITMENAVEGVYGKVAVSPGVEVKIVDDENKIVPRGKRGEVCTRSCVVFQEYLEDPEETKNAKSKTGWLHTGDIGSMDEQGKIEILGRKSMIIKRLTVKIFPGEIEKIIQQHPLVSDVKVVGIPDQQLYEELCACVILRQEMKHESFDEKARLKEVEDWCQEQWPPRADGLSMTPKYFLSMKNFPVLASGKVFIRGVKDEAMKQLGVTEHK